MDKGWSGLEGSPERCYVTAARGRRRPAQSPLSLGARRLAHRLKRGLTPGPQLEAGRALRDQDLPAVDRARAGCPRCRRQLRLALAVDEVDDRLELAQQRRSEPELRELLPRRRREPDRRAVDQQLGSLWLAHRALGELSRQRCRALASAIPD